MRNRNPREIGLELKKIRKRLGLTVREVESSSKWIAEHLEDNRYSIAVSVLSDMENHGKVPSVFKIFSLSVIYQMSIQDLIALLGFDAYKHEDYSGCVNIRLTHPLDLIDRVDRFDIPLRFDPAFTTSKTALLNRMIQEWGTIPFEFLRRNHLEKYLYAHIGENDNLLYPLLMPGCIVKVDATRTEVVAYETNNEYERPIYLVKTHEAYRCSWCMVQDRDIVLVPHHLSNMPQERYRLEKEAQVMGRVVGVWLDFNADGE